jgi:hypothetical protein
MQFDELWDRIWRDKRGKVVIWQMPNAFLIGWAVLTMASLIVSGKVADVLAWAAIAALAAWALLEIVKGVNYFRRFLGIAGLLAVAFLISGNI